jgi:hypothetical protein
LKNGQVKYISFGPNTQKHSGVCRAAEGLTRREKMESRKSLIFFLVKIEDFQQSLFPDYKFSKQNP